MVPRVKGERRALNSVLLSGLLSQVYTWTATSLSFRNGLCNGVSRVSLGIWTSILQYAPWIFGLPFGWIGMKKLGRLQATQASQKNANQ